MKTFEEYILSLPWNEVETPDDVDDLEPIDVVE